MTKQDVERLCVEIGHAINANNGQCALIEDALCRTTTLCVQVLADMDKAAPLSKEIFDEVLRVGGMMSNVCWNLSHADRICDERARKNMRECHVLWDAITHKLHEATRRAAT